jgi:hypothetical protein
MAMVKLSVAVTADTKKKKKNQQTTKIYLMELKKMAKMREFLFWNDKGQEEKKENTSLKKAIKSVQENFKNQLIGFEYISKKGKKIVSSIQLPLGRKKKIGR